MHENRHLAQAPDRFLREARQTIGWVIVGGLLLGTFFTLFIIPSAYVLLAGEVHGAGTEPAGGKLRAHAPAAPRKD